MACAKRVRFIILLAAICASSNVFGQQRPNVVLIISDDQAWTDYGFMGHATIKTPNLDRLASESAVFRRGYVPTALCRPSLATLVTGRYAFQHGICGNDPVRDRTASKPNQYKQRRARLISHLDNFDTVPRLLSEKGYLSHQSGKWWEGSYLRGGFTHGMTRGFPNRGGRHGDDGLAIGREGMEPVTDFIDESVRKGKPFFVWYAPFLPHTPHNPPPRLLNKYKAADRPLPVAKYFAMCEWFDETCGQLLHHIKSAGVEDNTLVVYVTDNGWIQRPDRNGFADRSKMSPYEAGIRTPIMFKWPGVIPACEREELCSSIDIVPTILTATRSRMPEGLPGLNLLPHLKDGTKIGRNAVFGEGFAHDVANVLSPDASLNYRWVIEDNWKLLLTYDGQQGKVRYKPTDYRPQLYDLASDPHEKSNLASQHPERLSQLAKRLEVWRPTERKTQTVWSTEPVVLELAK